MKKLDRPMPKPDAQWFQGLIVDRKLTQRKVASMMNGGEGISPELLSRKLNGIKRFDIEDAIDLSRILKQPLLEVIRRAGYKLPPDYDTVAEVSPLKVTYRRR